MKIIKFIFNAILITGAYISAIFMGERAAMYYYTNAKRRIYEFIDNDMI